MVSRVFTQAYSIQIFRFFSLIFKDSIHSMQYSSDQVEALHEPTTVAAPAITATGYRLAPPPPSAEPPCPSRPCPLKGHQAAPPPRVTLHV
jgi:hypothetical protein